MSENEVIAALGPYAIDAGHALIWKEQRLFGDWILRVKIGDGRVSDVQQNLSWIGTRQNKAECPNSLTTGRTFPVQHSASEHRL